MQIIATSHQNHDLLKEQFEFQQPNTYYIIMSNDTQYPAGENHDEYQQHHQNLVNFVNESTKHRYLGNFEDIGYWYFLQRNPYNYTSIRDLEQPFHYHDQIWNIPNRHNMQALLDFIATIPDDATVVVTCDAGVSRTGAVVDYLQQIRHADLLVKDTIDKDNPNFPLYHHHFHPNNLMQQLFQRLNPNYQIMEKDKWSLKPENKLPKD